MIPDTPKGVATAALIANGASAAGKIVAYAASGSSALLSEAIHSLAAIAHQILMLFGLQQAGRPADARHAFGHAKEIYFWSFIAGILLYSHGAGVAIYEGIQKLKAPPFLNISAWSYGSLGLTLALQLGLMLLLRRPQSDDADGQSVHAALTVATAAAIAGPLIALAGLVATDVYGVRQADAAASLAVGFVMAATAAFLSLKIKSVIVGQSASPGVRSALRRLIAAEAAPGKPIAEVREVRTLQLGLDDILVAANVTFREGETARAVEETAARLDRSIKSELPQVSHVFLTAQSEGGPDWDDSGDDGEDADALPVESSRSAAPVASAGLQHASRQPPGPHRKQRKKRRRH